MVFFLGFIRTGLYCAPKIVFGRISKEQIQNNPLINGAQRKLWLSIEFVQSRSGKNYDSPLLIRWNILAEVTKQAQCCTVLIERLPKLCPLNTWFAAIFFFSFVTIITITIGILVSNRRHTYLTCVTGFDIAFVFVWVVSFFFVLSSFVCEMCVFCWVYFFVPLGSRFGITICTKRKSENSWNLDTWIHLFNSLDVQFSYCHPLEFKSVNIECVYACFRTQMYLIVIQACIDCFFLFVSFRFISKPLLAIFSVALIVDENRVSVHFLLQFNTS